MLSKCVPSLQYKTAYHVQVCNGDHWSARYCSFREKCVNGCFRCACPTLGREALEPELWVVMVSTVVMPRPTLAGAASMLIQKETQDRMTMSRLGMYIWIK